MADCVVAQLTTCRVTRIVPRIVPRMAAVRPALWVHREEPVDHVPNDLRLAPSAQRDGDDRTSVGHPAKAACDTEELGGLRYCGASNAWARAHVLRASASDEKRAKVTASSFITPETGPTGSSEVRMREV